nr:S-adenosyl-L-methionine-dependent tRNA 4-demethylwyosine synthase [Ipomoea batatas]
MSPSATSLSTRLAVLGLLSATTIFFFYKSRRHLLRRLKASTLLPAQTTNRNSTGKIFFLSETGTSKTLAHRLRAFLALKDLHFDLIDPRDYEPEDLHKESVVLIVASTWEDGKPPKNGGFLGNWLTESSDDFRVGALLLSKCKFAIFGVGSRSYGETFNAVAKDFSKRLRKLGAAEVLEGVVEESDGEVSECDDYDSEIEENGEDNGIVDLEDIAGPVWRSRWTKSQLRGRGGCYKHSFYGIESHRCMEATPSLACANKCVFCWRHHTNPVGKSWRWKMDDPLEIVETAIELHSKMIKQMKGVPGVKADRLAEGLSPRHCALSLVGEPIMYPEINSLVDELHRKRISTFLVTNAQFPDRIMMLKPITQLYVSVDAATKESLKAIDRPLFGDFWERFMDSLKALKEKQQRTVYRLTLVKGWNTEDVDAYSSLFSIGNPDFIEIKGVTYCGSSATSKLTMENVPWHSDVKEFSEALAKKSNGEYEVACEHVHSCCVLLAKVDKFKIDGQWFTWIDYEKFHDLVASGKPFSSGDYMAPTPSWAVYGAEEGGFDPEQSRYKKERHHRSTR